MPSKKVSISDVARRAKVSLATVSRVINKVPTVNKENVAKVEEAIVALKYKPNVSAQRLASGSNNAIGLVMPGYPGIFHSYYAIELIRGVGHACEALRMDLMFHITDGARSLNANAFGGVVFADIIENRKQVEACVEDEVPCMVVNNIVRDMDVSYIAVDNTEGGSIAADYFISLGHKRIATVTGNLQTQSGSDRLKGFQQTLEKNNIELPEDYIQKGDYSRRSARQAAENLLKLESNRRPTAIFAASDDMALEIVAVANEMGINVPNDLSLIGFDDSPEALYGAVGLTTIRQPLFQMAEDAVRNLHQIISGKKEGPIKVVLSPELVIRDSCSQPPA